MNCNNGMSEHKMFSKDRLGIIWYQCCTQWRDLVDLLLII